MVDKAFLNIPTVDDKETAKQVVSFLTKTYDKQLRIYETTKPANLQSPSFDDMPKGAAFENNNEKKLIKYLHAKTLVSGMQWALEVGSDEMKIVLQQVLGIISTEQAKFRLHIEKTRYYEIKTRALVEFADIYEMQNGCPDLHVYID